MFELFDWGNEPPKRIAFCDNEDSVKWLKENGFAPWLERNGLKIMVSFQTELDDFPRKSTKDSPAGNLPKILQNANRLSL